MIVFQSFEECFNSFHFLTGEIREELHTCFWSKVHHCEGFICDVILLLRNWACGDHVPDVVKMCEKCMRKRVYA